MKYSPILLTPHRSAQLKKSFSFSAAAATVRYWLWQYHGMKMFHRFVNLFLLSLSSAPLLACAREGKTFLLSCAGGELGRMMTMGWKPGRVAVRE
jgi:hypothetical protein